MSSDISPTEKEEREVERLIDKEPAPSRKHREKRGPKHDNRRRRMKTEDPDMGSGDPDLSLNRKTQGAVLRAAFRITYSLDLDALESAISRFEGELRDISPSLADDFAKHAREYNVEWAKEGWADEASVKKEADEIRAMAPRLQEVRKNVIHALKRAEADDVVRAVVDNWPSGRRDGWAEKAAVLAAIESAIDRVPLPQSYKSPFLRGSPSDYLHDRKLLRKLIETAGKTYSMRDVEEEAILHFAQLAAAYRILQKNPSSVDEASLKSGMDELAGKLQEQSEELVELGSILEAWNDMGSQIKRVKKEPGLEFDRLKDYDKVIKDLDSFFSKSELVDPGPMMAELEEYTRSTFDELPPELEGAFDGWKRAAASNEDLRSGAMSRKVATFHGVDDRRGNPVQSPNTGYKSFHSRNFTEDNYKAILAYADALLEQPWLKYNWDGGTRDAQVRAALDLAVHMADDSLYQAKIDAETYNLLYNRLARAGHDSFSETVVPVQDKVGKKRSATMRNSQEYKSIVRVASDLRGFNPAMSFQILKNLRALVSTGAPSADTIESHVALEETSAERPTSMDEMAGCEGATMVENERAGQTMSDRKEPTVGQAPGDEIEFRSMGDDDFKKLKQELKREVDKLFSEDDVEKFFDGFEDMIADVEKKTASSFGNGVPLTVLVKLASSNEVLKLALGPILVAAKKKKDSKKKGKKKPEKKPEKKEEGNKNPFGDKKAPPFGDKKAPPFGGKKAPPFGGKKGKGKKRKANLTKEDLNW